MNKSIHAPHIIPLKIYLGVGSGLIFLTIVTVAASMVDLGSWNIVLALLIAGFKASLVALFFMHLKYDNKLYLFSFIISIVMLVLLLIITLFDTLKRDAIYDIESQPINKQAEFYKNIKDKEHEKN